MDTSSFAVHRESADQSQVADAEIESLARDADVPFDLVQKIYASERASLERTARIKTFVPVLIHQRVKALLREQRAS